MARSDDETDIGPENCMPKKPRQNPKNNIKFVDAVLNGSNEMCMDHFRMDKHIFYKLCGILQARGLLRHTNKIKIEEQLAIFLFIIGHNLRNRAVQEQFQYSGETISRHFNNVLDAIVHISKDFYNPPGADTPPEILQDPRLYPYFKDCVGAIDSIHFPIMVGVDEQWPFRDKNGSLSQIVLAACSFDMKFHYVLAGYEGSVSELKVLNAALTRKHNLTVPEGKYYIVDTKYANMPGFVAPYCGVPYHVNQLPSGYCPRDARELFNQRHSVLCSVTGRLFGALKHRFPILVSASPYPLPTQVKLVVAACALHNYICVQKPDDCILTMYRDEKLPGMEESLPSLEVEQPSIAQNILFDQQELEFTELLRDSIASEMWDDYVQDFSGM